MCAAYPHRHVFHPLWGDAAQYDRFEASMCFKHGIYRRRIQDAISPKVELFQPGRIEAVACLRVKGAEAFSKQAFQVFEISLKHPFAFSFFSALL